MQVKYNSWYIQYKKPFGAIYAGQTVRWAIEVNEPIQEVILWLTKNSEDHVPYKMEYDSDSKKFVVRVTIESSGLYHYYFAIKSNNQEYYLEKGPFGVGKLTQSNYNLQTFQLTCADCKLPNEDWYKAGIVYQIFPDRFYNGNPHHEITGRKKNTFLYATEEDTPYYIKKADGEIARWDFFGGNLLGIQKKIPYLKELGINTVYLNPIFLAKSNHRYDTVDFTKIDTLLGTENDLKNLVEALHKNGMHIILDGVFNHVGKDSIYFQDAISSPSSPYYPWFKFSHYPDQYQSWWGIKTMPEVDKENKDYQNFIYGEKGILSKWTSLGIDGWRLDVADELPMDFLKNIRQRLAQNNCHVLIGEVWEDASHKFVNGQYRPYTTGYNLTGVMNYPVRLFIINLLNAKNSSNEEDAMNSLAAIVENYPTDFLQNCLNNIGTHDTERIKTIMNNNEQKVAIAFGLLFMLIGVPCIYYGDEVGLIGGKDPDNRRYFPWNNQSQFLKKTVRDLIAYRKNCSTLINGKIAFIQIKYGINAIVRYDNENIIVYCYNCTQDDVVLSSDEFIYHCLSSDLSSRIAAVLNQMPIKKESYLLKKFSKN
ncbi:glycoside hydrolase family 13 protein [Lactobacillus sp. LL6]|uniref:glycoside hydrolase family 13 protein n=1 Tax=Lactobacillus sp. LL6 TaxID=2596827 RepID=UPI001185EAEE|nr:glycoside hydrolase family 13 protein [Lactobacillus sp. LL6]TSO26027.1 glycoside hydrolase family 13 protein [Lactobacillus sp. LL6]